MNRNYIGDLQVYCQQRGLPLPSYVDIPNTSGIGFSVECTLNNYKKVGNGTNKKQAKQMAASLMLELVEGDGFRRECTPSPQPRGVSPAAALANFSIRGPFDSSPRRSDGEPQLSPSDSDEERVTIKVRISKGTVRRLMRTDSLTPAFRLIPLYILGEHDFDVFDAVEIAPLSAKPLDVLDPHSSSVSQISEQPNMTSFSPESSARTSPSLNLISGSVGSEDQRILEIASRQKTNPIAALQEISASRKWKPPVYDELPSDGSGFHCRCCFLDSESIGSGPNKKAAKKEAAQATLSLFLNSRGLSDSGAPYKEASTSSQATLNPIMGPFQDPLAPMALSKVTAQASTFMSPSQAPTLGVADSDPQFSLLEQVVQSALGRTVCFPPPPRVGLTPELTSSEPQATTPSTLKPSPVSAWMTTPSQRSDGFPTFPPVSAVTTTPFPVSARMTTPPPVSPGFPTPPPVSPGFPTPPSVSAGAPTPLLVSSADDPPNYVGELLDLCQHRRWSRPEYSVAREEDNERGAKTFFVQCTVQGKQGEGQGRTKQQAKHQSAAAVLGLLKDPPRPMQPGEVGICEEGPSSEGSGEVPTAVLIDVPLPPTWAPSRQENASVRLDSMPPSSVQTDVFTAETYQSNKETNSDSDTTCDSIVKAFPLVPNGIAVTNNKLRSRETFTKKTADVLTRPLQPSLAYLYHISMRQTYTYEDELRTSRTTDFHIETAPLCFGLVNASPLPPLNPFPIFIRSGEIEVQLERRGEIVLGDETLKRLRHFNRFLFREVLRLEREPMVHSETEADQKFLMVPLNREREIDLDFLERIFAMDKFLPRKPSEEERQAFVYDSTRYQDTVITPWYRGDSISEFHFVVNVWKNKTPNSGFPEKERLTFKQYYEEKYQEKIYCDNQPLLQGLLTTSRPGFDVVTPHSFSVHGGVRPLAAPMQVSKRQSKRGNQPALYVPELCSVHPFPASLWQQALCLPYSLAKINALLLADELRLNFAQALHLGAPPPDHRWDRMDVGWSLKDVLQTSGRENEEQENEKNPSQMELFPKVSQVPQFGPSPGKILVALTMINAFECANQERLELMGDAFLKYAVSVKLFIDEPTKQEGDMTRLRSQIVSNEYLYLLGKHLGLGHRVVPSKFSATDSWLPPGYGVDKSSRRGGLLKEQQLHPKNIADTVEALIGAYLTSCGHDKALAFMRQIGIEVIPTSTQIRSSSAHFYGMLNCEDFRTAPEDFRTTSWKEQGFEELEETLGYQFGDGRYLLQALTHKSFVERQTESMERLEFLGDAVLGYVVTQYLYEVCKQSDPGELTDIRTAIVNNLTFACVAVQVGLHRPLKIASPVAEAKIKGFVDFCKSRTLSQVVRSEEGLAMEDVQSVEGIDVPKELGDVLEAVAGAVFLDSGLSLAVVWRVFGKVLKEAIQEFTERVPKNPVRQLYELKCGHVTVEDSVALNNGMMKVVIEVHGERKFEGIGPNGKIAKYNAALTALMYLRKTSPQL